MTDSNAASSAHRALGASTLALVVACASIVPFVPPMVEATVQSIPRIVLLSSAIVVGLLLHWVFLGIAARRLQRSVLGWVALAVGLFPIGGVTALILLGFFGDEAAHAPPAPAPGG
jgi:cytochrome bd-type quinol oxidase subunit 2